MGNLRPSVHAYDERTRCLTLINSVTALLAQDIFEGQVYGILCPGGNYHCFNVFGDCVFDLTSEQFGDEILDYTNCAEQSRSEHFAKEEKRLRYEYLKEKLNEYLRRPAMKKHINITDYANQITAALPGGILLNTNGDKFNSMVIGWGHLGRLWNTQTFHVYVRQGRYTKAQLDKTKEFSISIPMGKADPSINKICGWQSGHNIDKVKEAGLELEDPEKITTPAVRQYPLTIECKILYSQDQDLKKIPADIREKMYPQDVAGDYPMANRDFHTMYVGEIVDAYIIE